MIQPHPKFFFQINLLPTCYNGILFLLIYRLSYIGINNVYITYKQGYADILIFRTYKNTHLTLNLQFKTLRDVIRDLK